MLTQAERLQRLVDDQSIAVSKSQKHLVFYAGVQAIRYYGFLSMLLERYLADERAFRNANERLQQEVGRHESSHASTPVENALLRETVHFHYAIQLNIESFYLFAKITLDRLAQFVEHCFGKTRNLSMISHSKFCRNLRDYCSERGLDVGTLHESACSLRELVSSFRDRAITHDNSPRSMRGITIGSEHIAMTVSHVYPKPSDKETQSSDLVTLAEHIDRYIGDLEAFFLNNQDDRSDITPN